MARIRLAEQPSRFRATAQAPRPGWGDSQAKSMRPIIPAALAPTQPAPNVDAAASSRVTGRILGTAAAAWLAVCAVTALWLGGPAALVAAVPLAAVAACLLAAWALPPVITAPWALFALAALAGAAQAVASVAAGPLAVEAGRALAPWPLALAAGGAAWLLHHRDRGRRLEMVLDGALLVAAMAIAVLRWAPGARAGQAEAGLYAYLSAWVTAPVAAGTLIVGAAVLMAAPPAAGPRRTLLWLGGACAAIALGSFPLVMGGEPCCSGGGMSLAIFLGGWSLLAAAGAAASLSGGSHPARSPLSGVPARQLVAPGAALVAAAALVDAGLKAPMQPASEVLLGLVALLLALRVSDLLRATRLRSRERVELAQSRALVEVSQSLAGALDVDRTLELVAIWACRLLGGRSAGLELLEGDGSTLVLRAAHGLGPQVVGMRFPVEGSFTGWVVAHGVVRSTVDPRLEPRFRRESRDLVGRSPTAAAPLRCHGRTLGALWCVAPHPFDSDDLELLCALADQAAIAIENARLFQQVNVLSKTDPLTGLANRRQLEVDLAREFAAARRGRALVAVMFDVNGFKDYNDQHGHLAGDDALRAFGEVLAGETRAMNLAARYGGDEFIVLLGESDVEGARVFASRVAEKFPRVVANLGRGELGVSYGLAGFDPAMQTPQDLIAAVDRALYAHKAERAGQDPVGASR